MAVSEDRISLCINCQEPPEAHHSSGRCLYAASNLEVHVCAGCKRSFEYTGDQSKYGMVPMSRDDYHIGCTSLVLKDFAAQGHPLIKSS
jgi:hypothetical protein